MDEEKLAAKLKEIAKRWNHSPEAALTMLDAALRQQSLMITPNFGPWPTTVEEYTLPITMDAGWPLWAEALIPTNSKFEKHVYEDGREIAKLVTPRALVLLATELSAGATKSG